MDSKIGLWIAMYPKVILKACNQNAEMYLQTNAKDTMDRQSLK